ncbi:uncharacterized protein LOC124152981 [Haliotis rufescens]|uniref:uncharacterized protein LOC124152981 n=1 Tax=Haliotis rufescens TaxID=6454 RepID=UPI00201EDFC9|nr:uncharacterized protein LOC124152981 [Haliotis rufescens]
MKRLTAKGLGTKTKQAEPITEESENTLWEKNMFGDSTSQSLLNTDFYYNCKLFGLRACDEHRSLQVEQIIVDKDQIGDYIEFRGTTAKNYNGGLYHRSVEAKNIRHHTTGDLPRLYNTYLSKIGNTGPFYRRPLPEKDNDNLRYSSQVIGVNKLKTLMKKMCESAGIEGYFTNHSGKRTCATRLYEEGIEEQEIMRITGHRSTKAVRKYKRPSQEMLSSIENVLDPPKKIKLAQNSEVITPSHPILNSRPHAVVNGILWQPPQQKQREVKTNMMVHGFEQPTVVSINVFKLEVVNQFTYRGSTIIDNLVYDAEINTRIVIARQPRQTDEKGMRL